MVNIFKMIKIFFLCLICFSTFKAFAFENLVYTWRGFPDQILEGDTAIKHLKAHASQIDILSSQAYHIDEKGMLLGSVNPQMVQIAKAQHVKFMPLVGNIDFDRARVHTFLHDTAAQNRAIQSILALCKKNNYDGVQIDFEGMSMEDRDVFTHFYQTLAGVLHQNKLEVSIAILPTLTADDFSTPYLKNRYERWTGVYDYKALGESSDFVTLMTYDQHGGITPPGPMSGAMWIESILRYALQYIPPQKISLGIPWHSGYWYTGTENNPESSDNLNNPNRNVIHVIQTDLSYAEMSRLLKDYGISLQWDDKDKVPYAFFTNNFLYEYIFAENAESFKAKLDIVKKYKLRGISNWCLGEEDPKVWDVLAAARNKK